MPVHSNVFRLAQLESHQGLSPGDLLVEVKQVTLVAGTLEVPTIFDNGRILGVLITQNDTAAINATETFATDMIVTSGAITVNGKTASTATVTVVIIGRPSI